MVELCRAVEAKDVIRLWLYNPARDGYRRLRRTWGYPFMLTVIIQLGSHESY